jgi:hypothetical protein
MSKIKVNSVVNKTDDGQVELTRGATIPSGQQLTVNGNLNITGVLTSTNYNATNVNVTGVITATTFVGSGANLTNLPSVNAGKILAYKKIFSYDECYRS